MLFKAGFPVSTGAAAGAATGPSGGGEKTYNNAYPKKIIDSVHNPIFNQTSAPGAWVILKSAPSKTGTAAAETKILSIRSIGRD
jgi:hypothetical protein